MSSIGIMDPAFFVGKNAILKWLNDFFQIGYTKIEQTASGAIHCQILDALYPGKVPLHKVNFDAKHEYEYVANYKVLQSVFDKEHIEKHVDVQKLVKAKYQDNLEFCQWIKNYFDTHYSGQEYNAAARREEAQKGYKKEHKHAGGATGVKKPASSESNETKSTTSSASSSSSASSASKPSAPSKLTAKPAASTSTSTASKPAAAGKKPAAASSAPPSASGAAKKPQPVSGTKPAAATKPSAAPAPQVSSADIAALEEQLSQHKLTVEGLEKERNFYFGKLRDIEILCQSEEAPDNVADLKKQILDILYAMDPDEEFQAPQEETGAAGDDEQQATANDNDENGEAGLLSGEEGAAEDEAFSA